MTGWEGDREAVGIQDEGFIEVFQGELVSEVPRKETSSWRRMLLVIIAIVALGFIVLPVVTFRSVWDESTSRWYLCYPATFVGAGVLCILILLPFVLAMGEFKVYEGGIVHRGLLSRRTFVPWRDFKGYRLTSWMPGRDRVVLVTRDGRETYINPTMNDFDKVLALVQERLAELGPKEVDITQHKGP